MTLRIADCELAANALRSWIIHQHRQLVYSTPQGAGVFENEGQSLRLYDVRTGTQKQFLGEYCAIQAVREVTTSSGRSALIVPLAALDASTSSRLSANGVNRQSGPHVIQTILDA